MSSHSLPSKRKAIAAMKDLTLQRISVEASLPELFPYAPLRHIFSERSPTDDPALVMLAAVALDQALEHAICQHFSRGMQDIKEQLFVNDGAPLGDMSAKIKIAFAFGIVGNNTKSDLDIFRHIRNTFAHSRSRINLDNEKIVLVISHINYFDRYFKKQKTCRIIEKRRDYELSPRNIFAEAIFQYSIWLFGYKNRKTKITWMQKILQD